MTLPLVREGLKSALEAIPGLRAYDTMPQSIPEAPAAYVIPEEINFHVTMADNAKYAFDVTVIVSLKPSFTEAQNLLDEFISPTGDRSIMAAIEADPTLGGECDAAWVHSCIDYGFVTYSDVKFLGCRFKVKVY